MPFHGAGDEGPPRPTIGGDDRDDTVAVTIHAGDGETEREIDAGTDSLLDVLQLLKLDGELD